MHTEEIEHPPCTICRSNETRRFRWGDYHLNLEEPLHVVRCAKCGMLYMSPRPSRAARHSLMNGSVPDLLRPYSRFTANYGAVTTSRATLFQSRLQFLHRHLYHRHHSNQIKILDVGASSGVFVRLARELGWDAYGVEPSVDELKSAQESGIELIRSVAEALPFAGNTFDIVHSHHVFEHLADPQIAVQEIHRVLKPGGLLFIEVPNQFDNIMFRRDMLINRVNQRQRSIRSIHHLWFFSRYTLRQLLNFGGFTDVKIDDDYQWQPRGWRTPFTVATRLVGRIVFGGYLVRGWGRKS